MLGFIYSPHKCAVVIVNRTMLDPIQPMLEMDVSDDTKKQSSVHTVALFKLRDVKFYGENGLR